MPLHAWHTLPLPAFRRPGCLDLPFLFICWFPVPLLCLDTEFLFFWFPVLDYVPSCNMIFVAQPRHAFACARGRGKTGVTITVTGLSHDLGRLILFLSLIQPFAKSHLFTEVNHLWLLVLFSCRGPPESSSLERS